MASNSGSRSGQAKKNTSSSRTRSTSNTGRSKTSRGNSRSSKGSSARYNRKAEEESAITSEIILICVLALSILLFLCNFGVIGPVGNTVSRCMFGIFGMMAYIFPVLIFVGIAFGISNKGSTFAALKIGASVLLILLLGVILEFMGGTAASMEKYDITQLYTVSSQTKAGGGVISGSVAYLMVHFLGMVGGILLVIVLGIICTVIITEKSFVGGVRSGSRRVYESAREDAMLRKERSRHRREELEARREQEEQEWEEERAREEAEKILRMDRKVSGVMPDTEITKDTGKGRKRKTDLTEAEPDGFEKGLHEIVPQASMEQNISHTVEIHKVTPGQEQNIDFDRIRIHTNGQESMVRTADTQEPDDPVTKRASSSEHHSSDVFRDMREILPAAGLAEFTSAPEVTASFVSSGLIQGEPLQEEALPFDIESGTERTIQEREEINNRAVPERESMQKEEEPVHQTPAAPQTRPSAALHTPSDSRRTEAAAGQASPSSLPAGRQQPERPYQYPPLSLLKKVAGMSVDSTRELKATAVKLQQTLATFGVKVMVTDISQGPAVTRYELQPETGVKVSKILSLSDDIKLNLAAIDIRIEAPIPGKAAVGIEVPNKESSMVGLRELLESKEFKDFPSKIAFAVGKDIAGKVVVSDISKMPHMLIAGSTGSGKSVCINTLIMSILYKAKPSEVKLILVDPKVVELSVYNGIPHLLIPVVTDPKQASAALHWGVAEMEDRYRKFADWNVRDLKGYNKKAEEKRAKGESDAPDNLPQIVIIVDELADLMMVAPGEVEESICRLAQLARAAGIHLIIATQRPSVDVITGLIKANMPSRVAFAVSSGVDSRTILDMNGAEKLLGKGDMMFYPSGYSKPARVQGAFVSDGEVSDIVDFLKNQVIGNVYDDHIVEKMKNIESTSSAGSGGDSGSDRDQYFEEAARFIIDKDKASIGMLQRVLRIGFNRAARIMEQLADAGVVGEEEGTKPRKILMSPEQFEQYIDESL